MSITHPHEVIAALSPLAVMTREEVDAAWCVAASLADSLAERARVPDAAMEDVGAYMRARRVEGMLSALRVRAD